MLLKIYEKTVITEEYLMSLRLYLFIRFRIMYDLRDSLLVDPYFTLILLTKGWKSNLTIGTIIILWMTWRLILF